MTYFFFKALPPRATFSQDMSDMEQAYMQEHVAYWTGLTEQGIWTGTGAVWSVGRGRGRGGK